MEVGTRETLRHVISSALKISYDTTGIPSTRSQQVASDFLLKSSLASPTLWNIIFPQNIRDFPAVAQSFLVHDFPSAYVLIRTLFEGYINMYYLLIDPITESELRFRLYIWDRHALFERQKMGKSLGSQIDQLEEVKLQIEKYNELIKTSEYYSKLSAREQAFYLKEGKWTKLTKLDLAKIAGFHESQTEFIYKLLSNYTHSEQFALMQIHSIMDPKESARFMKVVIRFTEIFLCLTLNIFGKVFPLGKSMIEQDNKLMETIEFWEELKSKDFKEMI